MLLQMRRAKKSEHGTRIPANGEIRYICTKCNKTFKSTQTLTRHMELHTGQFSYFCETCRKGFNSKNPYEAHMRAHQGLKYECEYCSKQFMDRQKYSYHLSEHTGQYRFKCNKCDKGFNVKKCLNNTSIPILAK